MGRIIPSQFELMTRKRAETMTSTKNNEITLQDVINHLSTLKEPEHHGGTLTIAALIITYFQKPGNEIRLSVLKKRRRYFPLYLSYLHVPLDHVDPISGEVDNLIRVAEDLERSRRLEAAA